MGEACWLHHRQMVRFAADKAARFASQTKPTKLCMLSMACAQVHRFRCACVHARACVYVCGLSTRNDAPPQCADCPTSLGVQASSANTTVLARVRVRPTPAARMLRMATWGHGEGGAMATACGSGAKTHSYTLFEADCIVRHLRRAHWNALVSRLELGHARGVFTHAA